MKKYLLILTIAFSSILCQQLSAQQVCGPESSTCGVDSKQNSSTVSGNDFADKFVIERSVREGRVPFYLFYAYDCPHCHEAMDFLKNLSTPDPKNTLCTKELSELKTVLSEQKLSVNLQQYEIKKDDKNRALFEKFLKEYKQPMQGVPTFFIGSEVIVGFSKDATCGQLINAIRNTALNKSSTAGTKINVPVIGEIDIQTISLPKISITIGFLDGFNPCAMWVLVFLLGLLVNAGSRRKILTIGMIFVVASAAVYFVFMAAWFNLFLVIGYSKIITVILASIAIIMGLVNLKEIFFFKKGVSLMIPEGQKPKLYQKARKILQEKNTLFAIILTVALAVFVNFIELACTVGFPAVFTKILADRNVGLGLKYFYMVIYNVAYVIPLLVIVLIFAITMGKFKMQEKHAKGLKFVSGLLMLILGLILLLKPELLILK